MNDARVAPKYMIGLIIIMIGALLLLRNLDIINFIIPEIIFSWQGILIIIGAIFILSAQNKSTGLVLIIVGVLGLIPEYWSIALILLGIYIIFKKSSFGRSYSNVLDNKLNELSIFGGGNRYFHSDNFNGGNVTTIFGGSIINLSDCKLAEGENVIDLLCVFGGSSFKIPSDWKVRIETTSIIGGFSDKRSAPLEPYSEEDKVLIIKGLILFGGGEIKNI
ncbi:MAG: cell wall-active antibiotics response protein [Chlorobi bacterium]|nr:cell wall-active antibiotics response protein [Chlorobiota bacterium]